MKLLYWAGIGVVVYAYIGYGVLVALLAWLRPRRAQATPITPHITIVVPCYNEAAYIAAKLDNCLEQDYPADRLEVLVIVSGSDDGTEKIVRTYASRGVRCLVQPVRVGKEAAMQEAARHAAGEILVFSDANAILNREALRMMVRWFADPSVGCVAGEKHVQSPGQHASGRGEGLYWRYESALKRLDSQVGCTMGAAGELIAIRASLMTFRETDNIIEDFVLSMRVVEAGYRVIYEPGAVATEDASTRLEDLFERRARIAAGGFQALWRLRGLLNPRRGLVWWQYVSHRALRWALVPFLLPLILGANARLARSAPLYTALLIGQVACYGAAAVGWWARSSPLGQHPAFYYAFFFVAVNAAALDGFVRLVTGRQSVLWKRTRS